MVSLSQRWTGTAGAGAVAGSLLRLVGDRASAAETMPAASATAPAGTLANADTEVALLRRIAQGSDQAFSEFYDRVSPAAFGLLVTILRSRADAEDVLQDVFWYIWKNAGTFQGELSSPRAWVLMIARSRAIDRVRARRTVADTDDHPERPGPDEDPAAAFSPASPRVAAALESLPAEQRDPIVMAFYRGLTREHIAQALGIPVGTVKTRIRAGISRLRELLGPSVPEFQP